MLGGWETMQTNTQWRKQNARTRNCHPESVPLPFALPCYAALQTKRARNNSHTKVFMWRIVRFFCFKQFFFLALCFLFWGTVSQETSTQSQQAMIFFGYFYLILPIFTALRVSSADFHYTLHNCNLFAPNNIDNALALLGEPFTTGPAVISEQYKFPHNRQTKSGSSLADRAPKFCTG